MKRILIDMDGVLADVYPRFFELYEQETGIRKTTDEIIGLKEGEAFPELYRAETIMFMQPHSVNNTGHQHKTVSSWTEIEKLLLAD